ncbi:MAG TPA: S8 family serine peptidase, partial [Ferruginibacter sp.]|nr:S8 family serine peptidase [Ferruginibacter sp.]
MKIDANLSAALTNSKGDVKTYAISYFSSISRATVEEELKKIGAAIVPTKFVGSNIVFIQPDKKLIDAIAAIPFVSNIRLQSITDKVLNNHSTQLHALSSLFAPAGRHLSGRSITVGVGDNSEVSTHIDFTGRLINRVYAVPSYHGLHTSGTVSGGGLRNPIYTGLAPKSTLVSQWFSDVVTNTSTYVTDYNIVATNNSYTTADDACPGEGVYDATSNYLDNLMRNYGSVLHVFAAGNDGGYTCNPAAPGYSTVKSGWQTAKNTLTVGALNQANYIITGFSSKGPVQDGRIKPEIVASGYNTWSTVNLNLYGPNSGTSMAAPVVTGAAAIMNERYKQLHGTTAKASLIKALMCNTAEDLGSAGP